MHYSKTVTFFVSALCALLLPYYVAGELQIESCKKEDMTPGIISIGDLSASGKTVQKSVLEFSGEMQPSIINIHIVIRNEDGDTMMEQNTDFCSLSSSDMFKPYLESFSESQFNQGNCPIDPGTYTSNDFDIQIDDGGEGSYTIDIEAQEGPNTLFRITCNAKVE